MKRCSAAAYDCAQERRMLQEEKKMRQNPILEKIEAEQIRVPGQFEVGDTVRVHNKIKEGNRERSKRSSKIHIEHQGGELSSFTGK